MPDTTAQQPAAPPEAAHGHDPHLAHHFHTPEQQFESGKLGMWLFLATEILLFAGLFCAYAVYRGLHPEIFIRGHEYLDKTLGAVNTVILLCSSFTMAYAVHAAQRSRRRLLTVLLALTFLGGCGFLGIKYVEYKHKWEHHLLWGKWYNPQPGAGHGQHFAAAPPGESRAPDSPPLPGPTVPGPDRTQQTLTTQAAGERPGSARPGGSLPQAQAHASESALPAGAQRLPDTEAAELAKVSAQWEYEPAASGPRGLLRGGHIDTATQPAEVQNVHQFFAIYFAMTGLHGLHVIAGMVVIAWLFFAALRGRFSAAYFTPVYHGGLYWHLVDVIWIFLFPLLYLIH